MEKTVYKKSFFSLVVAILMLISIVPANFDSAMDAVAAADGFYVDGTTIRDANGQAFVMRGVNIPHAWYAGYTSTAIKGAAARGANAVRIVCSDGLEYSKTSLSQLNNIINWCKSNKVICILEVHDKTGSNDVSVLNAAVNYWIEMKSALQGNEKYVILNIANEWFGAWNRASEWAEAYKSAIKSIRNAGINNMIMVDAEGYGQWPSSIFQKGKEVFNADPNKNTIFSIHMYQDAGKNSYTVKSNIDQALALNIPVVIGEFADDHQGADVDEQTIMSYCTEKNVGYLGWSWKGNGSGLESLDIAKDWSGSSLSTWGDKLFNGTYGITKTSKICSIYTGIIEDSSSKSDSSSGSGVLTDNVITQGGSGSLTWNTDYTLDFSLSGYNSAKIVVEGNANQLKLAVDPGWVELVYTTDVYGNYEYNFSASDMSKFSGNHKLYVQGQGSVDSVKIIGYKESPIVPDSSSKEESSSEPDDSSLPEVTGTPEYVSTNLTLTGIIGANAYYSVPEGYVNSNYKVEAVFTAKGVNETRVTLDKNNTKTINGQKTYVFTVPIKSCDMSKRYSAKLVVSTVKGNEVVASTSTSTIKLNSFTASLANIGNTQEKAFAKAMQTYGYYSQKMFNTTESLPTVALEDLSDVTYSTVRRYATKTQTFNGTKKGNISGTSLHLDSGTGIRSYITDLSGVDTNNLYMQYTANGVTERVKVQYNASNQSYYGEIPDIAADKLSTMYDICFCEGTTQITDTVKYGAYSYIYSTLRISATEDMQNLVKALYKYSVAAEAILG